MRGPLIHYGGLFFSCLSAYLVYRSNKKRKLKFGELWIVFSFLLPPAIFFYYIYAKMVEKRVVLTKRQKLEAEQSKIITARKKEILEARQIKEKNADGFSQEQLQQKEQEKERLKELLEEERNLQEERKAKKLKLK